VSIWERKSELVSNKKEKKFEDQRRNELFVWCQIRNCLSEILVTRFIDVV